MNHKLYATYIDVSILYRTHALCARSSMFVKPVPMTLTDPTRGSA